MTDANSTESNSNPTNSLAKPIIIGSCIIAVAIIAAPHLAPRSAQSQKVGVIEESQWPIPAAEVARQFEKVMTISPIKTTVHDVRFSDKKNTYRVEYTYTNRDTGKSWQSGVDLSSNEFGRYSGAIRHTEFLIATGRADDSQYFVEVKTPSTL